MRRGHPRLKAIGYSPGVTAAPRVTRMRFARSPAAAYRPQSGEPVNLMRLLAAAVLAALLSSCGGNDYNNSVDVGVTPKVGHVFIVVLENENADSTFGETSAAPFLAHTLSAAGAYVPNYYATGHLSLDNYISMVSGQAPNPMTQADCQTFQDWIGSDALVTDGQVVGQGCVYPATVLTIADQLEAAGKTWKGYMEDMGNDIARDGSATCAHPPLNAQDPTQRAAADDNYATRHNPFMYFHSIIDEPTTCDANVVPLTALDADLASVATTANYTFITPGLCHDAHDQPCANGEPGGLESADAFLKVLVPKILASPAYRQDGLLIITFDEAEADPRDGDTPDASACCGEVPGPNSPAPGGFGLGGGRVGAVMLSPLIRPGTVSQNPYNHYSMLRSIEDTFGLEHLGYAGAEGLVPFGDDIFTNR
jgi:phosphatidylinositol-3-phosphatase